MTRDEVMALSDEELRIKAAELAGWQRGAVINGVQTWTRCTTGGKGDCGWGHITECGEGALPDYPHDIAPTWSLIEPLMGKMSLIQIMIGDEGHIGLCGWIFDDQGRTIWTLEAIGGEGFSIQRTITRAFILVMAQEEGGGGNESV